MNNRGDTGERILLGVVLLHLAISAIHGFAHAQAQVSLSPAASVFVFGVILIGPILGLMLRRTVMPWVGAWMIAATMVAALAFGLANHFLITGSDHVTHVAAPWRALFGTTAALLVFTEAFGAAVAVWCATRIGRRA
jgi:hypothetical protein